MVNFLDLYITEIYKQFVVVKQDEYRKSKKIFDCVFHEIKQEMKKQCKFFQRYSKQDMYAGSVYDRVKIGKMDEFDMDIVIKLPVNYDKIQIEAEAPGFVKLKIPEFDLLHRQKNWEDCHKITLEWRDSEKYLLQNKFRQWVHSLIQKSLNVLQHKVTVDGTSYSVKYKESGPAYTLKIRNESGDDYFALDVDLVPVIKFQAPRWPGERYRRISSLGVNDWLVVPKTNKWGPEETRDRTWRLSFQEFERHLMKRGQHLKPTLRLLKKLRDTLKMDEIASYYIKTLFLWKVYEEKAPSYWRQNICDLFRIMVKELFNAISTKKILYFWHEENNLINNVDSAILKTYVKKLKQVVDDIDLNKINSIVAFLLTKDELVIFQNSEFYRKHNSTTPLASTSYLDNLSLDENVCLEKIELPKTSKSVENSSNTHDKHEVLNINSDDDQEESNENNEPMPSKETWTRKLKKALFNSSYFLMAINPSTDWNVNPNVQMEKLVNILPFQEYNSITLEDHVHNTEYINYVTQRKNSSGRKMIDNETGTCIVDDCKKESSNDYTEDKDTSQPGKYEADDYHQLSDDDISW